KYASTSVLALPSPEHTEHAVRHQVPAEDVYGGEHDGDEGKDRGERAPHRGRRDGTHDGDARERVGAGHQRRVELRGHLLDQLAAEEDGQHEDEEQQEQYRHAEASMAVRTRSSRMWPSCVSRQPETISSVLSSLNALASASQACSIRL